MPISPALSIHTVRSSSTQKDTLMYAGFHTQLSLYEALSARPHAPVVPDRPRASVAMRRRVAAVVRAAVRDVERGDRAVRPRPRPTPTS